MPRQLLIDPDIPLMAEHFTRSDKRAWTCTEVENWLESVGLHKQGDGCWLGCSNDIYCLVDSTEIRRVHAVSNQLSQQHWHHN